ncbi:putative protein [Methanobacterium congolense]|uniref:Uncharacterized protein n=2 Tax=Methanobacterium congolense TaxID=118062 RepID=A0A1D3KZS9_9EURY|nr:putative protein [Methanobacterium congolense]
MRMDVVMVSQRDKFTLSDHGTVEKYSGLLLDEFDVEGLKEVVSGLKSLESEGFHERFFEAYLVRLEISVPGAELSVDEKRNDDMLTLAYQNLNRNHFFSLKKDLILFEHFSEISAFLLPLYYMCLGRKFTHGDVKAFYDARIDERLVFLLDEFDEPLNVPKPTPEFFKKLKKLQWQDKKTKKLYDNLRELLVYAGKGFHIDNKLMDFQVRERIFLLSLMACSAVVGGRDRINLDDVVRAYRTYLKLLKTDLPALVGKLGV